MEDPDGVGALALGDVAQVAKPRGLLDSEFAGHADYVEPPGELIDCDERHDRARE